MDKKHFDNLAKSIDQMNQIHQGKIKPAKVTKFNAISIRKIRQQLHQSQAEFALMIGVSPSTLRNWEQGLRKPEGPAMALLTVAKKNPVAVYKALH